MKPALLMLAGALAVAGALWLAWPQQQDAPAPGPDPVPAASAAPGTPVAAHPWLDAWPPAKRAAPAANAPVAAAHSLAQTRLHGDPEAPPIAQDIPAPARPTAAELADPQAYQAFEARQNTQVLAAYIKAVDEELPRLREDIARGRAMGIAADKIARAEEKARGLESMRAQLLKDHPVLGR